MRTKRDLGGIPSPPAPHPAAILFEVQIPEDEKSLGTVCRHLFCPRKVETEKDLKMLNLALPLVLFVP